MDCTASWKEFDAVLLLIQASPEQMLTAIEKVIADMSTTVKSDQLQAKRCRTNTVQIISQMLFCSISFSLNT